MANAKDSPSKAGLILTGIGIAITFLGFCLQYYNLASTQKETNEQSNRESYFKPLAMEMKFSNQLFTKRYAEKNVTIVDIPKIDMYFYQGFPIGIKTFSGKKTQELVMLSDTQYDVEKFIKEQKSTDVSELSITLESLFPLTDESEHFYYSITYLLVRDFTNQKQLALSIYIVPKLDTEITSIANAYIWDSDYSLLKNAPTYKFMEDNGRLTQEEKSEVGVVLKEYLDTYSTLLKEVETL